MTSGEVAIALGVGASTVKRWTDTGELKCVKTLGKHRRFAKAEVQAFAKRLAEGRAAGVPVADTPDTPVAGIPIAVFPIAGTSVAGTSVPGTPVASDTAPRPAGPHADSLWVDMLTRPGPAYVVQAALLGERAKLGSWHQVAAHMGVVFEGLGGDTSPIATAHRHLASERLLRGLILVNESLTVRDSAPTCLLAAAEADEQTLDLALLELTLRESGWQPHWLGRKMSPAAIATFVRHTRFDMVTLSASAAASDARQLAEEARVVGEACKSRAIALVLAGRGAWPEAPLYGHRVRTFTNFYSLLSQSKG